MPQVEQPLDMEQNSQMEVTNHSDSLSSFQIQESKSLDSNKSFTSTLKELFGNKSNHERAPSDVQSSDEAFNFNLIKERDEEPQVVFETPEEEEVQQHENQELSFVNDTNMDEIVPIEDSTNEVTFTSLSALGLSPDDEFDLLSDFISDAKESIESIEQFRRTKDFDKINYSLVKIKSSAEILNLNAIIENANSVRKYCITENSEKVIQETEKLKENIELLEKQLEATAI